MSRKHTGGQPGKGRPTPKRGSTGTRSRPVPTRTTAVKGPVYRQRKNPPLPVAVKALLALVWLGAAAATYALVDPWPARIGIMIGVTFALVVVTVLALDPSRRRR